MKNTHTPGPWYIGHHTEHNGEKSIDIRKCFDTPPAPSEIYQIARLPEAAEANARLIAAAPDLLQVVEDYLLLCQLHDYIGAVPDAARSAIAKAKGEA